MKTYTLSFIKKRIKKFLIKIHPSAVAVIKQYIDGKNFKQLEQVLPLKKAKKINLPVLQSLAETLIDSHKFEEKFSYDLLLGNRFLGDQDQIDTDEKIEFFNGIEFSSVDFQTALKDAYITLFLSDNLSDKRNVISITDVVGGSVSFKLFYRVNVAQEKNTLPIEQTSSVSRKAA